MSRHLSCPWCLCDGPTRLQINVDAPLYDFVVELDRVIYDDYIARRTAARLANSAARQLAEVGSSCSA